MVECSCCGKEFSMLLYDARTYAWKVLDNGDMKYQCSYTCFRKEEKRLYDNGKKDYNRVRCD